MSLTNLDIKKIGDIVDERLDKRLDKRFGKNDKRLLGKVDKMIKSSIRENNVELYKVFVTKPELTDAIEGLRVDLSAQINDLKDIVLGIKKKFDYEITLMSGKTVLRHESMLEDHEERIGVLEDK